MLSAYLQKYPFKMHVTFCLVSQHTKKEFLTHRISVVRSIFIRKTDDTEYRCILMEYVVRIGS